ncbi:hypothetical protein [Crocosphaera chwakensis]|uniref:Uncharacterized protein n=1 Tax=Crocosphaera chwakensis CCY0110 TaxID=391612 RepID=A3ITU4_9CHRO|nr:hypothetical protein [Crocosphaera chwakensis]EAZ90039.1 hypothetical protein CY0110_14875 [Crocosphaera chwakensis CCY0110]
MLLEIRTFNERDSQKIIELLSSKTQSPVETYNFLIVYSDFEPRYYTEIKVKGTFLELSTEIRKLVRECWIQNHDNHEECIRDFEVKDQQEYINLIGGLKIWNQIINQRESIKESEEFWGIS